MPNNPVQIILNANDFRVVPEQKRGGSRKDFFAGADSEFKEHKEILLSSVDKIGQTVAKSRYGPATYLRVQMRELALAKSYRPIRKIFKQHQFPCVGADMVGTLFFRAPLVYMNDLRSRIDEAEDIVQTKRYERTNEEYLAPTLSRSEVGAVDSIQMVPPEEKRRFSVPEALKILGDEQTFSGYRIELFENPKQLFSQEKNRDLLELVRSLLTTLHSIGAGARTYVSSETDHTLNLELHLTCDKAEAFVDERLSASEFEGGQKITFAETDFDADRHEEVLSILQAHPLVRRIRLPIGLRLSNMENEMLNRFTNCGN